jgi:hypothetical protein
MAAPCGNAAVLCAADTERQDAASLPKMDPNKLLAASMKVEADSHLVGAASCSKA